MGKAARKSEYDRQPGETGIEYIMRLSRLKANARNKADPIVPVEAEQHGDYRNSFVTHVETNTKVQTKLNRGGSPVDRWEAAGKLNDNQLAVIYWCHGLWEAAGITQRVTANYGERVPASHSKEAGAHRAIEAREDLYRIQDYFPGPLQAYWSVYENVCRFDMPAGVAGTSLGYGSRSAQDRAHQIVCFVADVIGTRERI